MEPAVFETADCKAEVQNSSGLKDTPEGMGSERSAHLAPLTPRQEIWEDMRPCTCSNEDAMGNALVFWSGNSGTPLPGREHPPPESSLRGVGENTHPPAPLTPELQVEAAMPVSATFKASMERFAGLIEQQGPQAYIPRFGQRGRVAAVNTSSCKVTSKRQTSAKPAV